MDKTKFTRDPQLDSEGFLDTAARCRGCAPGESCPRSGHCERYDSPLRFITQDGTTIISETPQEIVIDNPEGWQEVGEGASLVKLPPITWGDTFDGERGTYSDPKCCTCSPWALLDQADLDRIHEIWSRSAPKHRQQLADMFYDHVQLAGD